MRSITLAILFCAALLGQEFTLKSTSDFVLLDVSVKNASGGYASGLPQESFRVFEGGKLQTISHFSHEDVPVTVGLLIDTSGSMAPKYRQVVAAALAFIAASNPRDEIFVVNFNDHVTQGLPPAIPFTDDAGLLSAALSTAKPEGRTSLYDAVALALGHLEKGRRDKKSLLIVSDGGDNHSTHKLEDVKRMVEESRATIYTIALFDEDDPERNTDVLRRLSAISGGEMYLPKDTSDTLEICRRIAVDMRSRYTIGYIPARNDDHAIRKIKVLASRPDGPKLVVRTRASYVHPGQ